MRVVYTLSVLSGGENKWWYTAFLCVSDTFGRLIRYIEGEIQMRGL